MTRTLTVFAGASTLPSYDQPRPERLVSRHSPLRTTWTHYEHSGVAAGVWSCPPGAWRIAFAPGSDEFFHIIEGRIRITDTNGLARDFGPGDACVIPGGFTGLFEVIETVRKHFVFIERAASESPPAA